MNPYFARQAKKGRIGDAGRESERRLAKSLKADLRPASGAVAGFKGDMALSGLLIEAKSTTADSLTVKRSWLAKVTGEAMPEKRTPVLAVTFTDKDGLARLGGEWAMIPMHAFKALIK